jgi:hypothetical protein
MTLVFDLGRGQRARLESTDGHFVTLVSTQPFPPGATLRGELEGEAPYLVKVRGSRRVAAPEPSAEPSAGPGAETTAPAEFIVEGRWVNLSRRQREKLGVGAGGAGTR